MAWDPYTASNIAKLKMVQRKAARFISNDWSYTSSPTTMLHNLNLQTLHQRRMEIKVKYIHKILHGHHETLSFLVTRARTANLRLVPIHARVLTYEHSFVPSTISLWNKLPVHIVNETDFDKFSSNIYNYEF